MKQPMNETLNFIPRRNSALVQPAAAVPSAPPLISARSCFELGVCQHHKLPCQDCDWQLAPGVIDGPYTRAGIAQRLDRLWLRWGPMLVTWGCIAVIAFWLLVILGVLVRYFK